MASSVVPVTRQRRVSPPAVLIQRVLGVAAAACLAVDTYVHLRDAGFYRAVTTPVLSQATLFRVQASLAAAAGLALLVRPSRPWWAAALLIAGSAFGAVMLYPYVNAGTLGPIPDMYEPTWAPPGKLASAWSEGAATVLAAAGLLVTVSERRGQPMRRERAWPRRVPTWPSLPRSH